jgi:SAM-dependent methyltransferase
MIGFYTNPPREYYELADASAGQYNADTLPFHCDLVSHIERGMKVVEVGCGTAHFCPIVESRGGQYTGLDWSPALLEKNRQRFANASFRGPDDLTTELYDLVASLYTVEHVVDPEVYLRRLWDCCRPGGLIGVICPEFIDSVGVAPSIFYGQTPRRFRQKVASGDLVDAFNHLLDWKVRVPAWKRRAKLSPPGAFWINIVPRALHADHFVIDADAVHLVRLLDIEHWFSNAGAEILTRGRTMRGVSPDVLAYNGYVLARKSVD